MEKLNVLRDVNEMYCNPSKYNYLDHIIQESKEKKYDLLRKFGIDLYARDLNKCKTKANNLINHYELLSQDTGKRVNELTNNINELEDKINTLIDELPQEAYSSIDLKKPVPSINRSRYDEVISKNVERLDFSFKEYDMMMKKESPVDKNIIELKECVRRRNNDYELVYSLNKSYRNIELYKSKIEHMLLFVNDMKSKNMDSKNIVSQLRMYVGLNTRDELIY